MFFLYGNQKSLILLNVYGTAWKLLKNRLGSNRVNVMVATRIAIYSKGLSIQTIISTTLY
jgi:hypothetical protein